MRIYFESDVDAGDALDNALQTVNDMFGGNVVFKEREFIIRRQVKGHKGTFRQIWSVTLGVKSSRGPGAKFDPRSGRHISAACWDVFGTFLDALPQGTQIETMFGTCHPGDPWQDVSVGRGYTASQMCKCR